MTGRRVRKRQPPDEAMQLTATNVDEVRKFLGAAWDNWPEDGPGPAVSMFTPDGILTARLGDWVVKDAKGKCYPYKQATFEAIYEEVEEARNAT